ncbi:MAG: hypothetical protein QME05_04380 [Candidatus Margulisbacteria bacterium]|nr:hypothetical protein [Candidatus Margulisiibacteriota bacterium]
MNIENSLSSLSSMYPDQIGSSKSQGSNLLSQLEENVAKALQLDNSSLSAGQSITETVNPINPSDVINYMAEISNQSIPGMQFNIIA